MKLYYCVIENNNDPDKTGKVQIRIIGKHPENRNDTTNNNYLPTTDLPWANIISPVVSQNISGQCDFMVPANGSVAICTFMDIDEQVPILLGTVPKIVESLPDFNKGFSDPNGVNPISDLVGESQISRLARNENIDQTIIQDKKDNIETSIDCNGTSFSEPQTEYNTVYPNNRVIESPSGHIIEIDDTTGVERIHIYHKSGTFDEYHSTGDKVERIENDKFQIIINDKNILIKGEANTRVEGDRNYEIVGNENKKVEGVQSIDIVGDVEITSTGGDITITSNGDAELSSSSTGKIKISNSSKNLYTILNSLMTTLAALTTFGSPTNHTISTTDAASINTLKSDLTALMQ